MKIIFGIKITSGEYIQIIESLILHKTPTWGFTNRRIGDDEEKEKTYFSKEETEIDCVSWTCYSY